jgi:uncharacterized protein YciI
MAQTVYCVAFEDDEAFIGMRRDHMPAHLAFLAANPAIRAAGPLLAATGPDGEALAGSGGMWLVDGLDKAAIEALVKADPFWPTGLRKAVRIMEWRLVHADAHLSAGAA